MSMKTRRRFRLLIALGILGLAATALAWLSSPRPLSPPEAAVVGTWLSPRQPDGSSTAVILNPNRSCRVRWLDAAGQNDPQQLPQNGRWRVKGETLVIDTRRPRVASRLFGGTPPPGHEWSFEVADEALVHGPRSGAPVVLRRSAEAPGQRPEHGADGR
jgi:hypothetical protein